MFETIKNLLQKIKYILFPPKFEYIQKEEQPKRKEFKGMCEYCLESISNPVNKFYCSYCKKWYCPEHRVPESHECTNPKQPKCGFREQHFQGGKIVVG